MNCCIISCVYPPEPVVSARMSCDLAEFIKNQGWNVTVLCPVPSRPINTNYSRYMNVGEPLIAFDKGVQIIRLPSYASPQSRLFKRLYESYSFGRHTCRYLSSLRKRPDVIYVNSWPLVSQGLIVRHAKKHNIPIVLQIMDVYPESWLNKVRRTIGKILELPLISLDKWIAQQSTSISVISENMRNSYILRRKIAEKKIALIPVWQNQSLFEPLPNKELAFVRYTVSDKLFTFLFLGNIGSVSGVTFIIRAFHRAFLDAAQLLIIGDGSEKKTCMNLAEKLNERNIRFISDPEVANVSLLQSMAHVCLLPLNRGAGMSSIPSKLSSYMLSGKPVIATVDYESDTSKIIVQANCGWVGEPENIEWLSSKMRELFRTADAELEKLGENGRRYGLLHFSTRTGVKQLSQIIIEASLQQFNPQKK